jgi:hypothetical protein
LKRITSKEKWLGSKPNGSYLKVFGSVCYKHVSYQLRRKLDDKGDNMILVGYHITTSHRLFYHIVKHVKISRDIIVDELKNWSSEYNTKKKDYELIVELDLDSSNEVTKNESQVMRLNISRTPSVRLHD